MISIIKLNSFEKAPTILRYLLNTHILTYLSLARKLKSLYEDPFFIYLLIVLWPKSWILAALTIVGNVLIRWLLFLYKTYTMTPCLGDKDRLFLVSSLII